VFCSETKVMTIPYVCTSSSVLAMGYWDTELVLYLVYSGAYV
jgi:hypothetical protein